MAGKNDGSKRGRWLVKTEPGCYSYSDLERDGKTIWDGVTNNLALKHLRSIKKGDAVLVYHTGDEKAVTGLAEAVSDPYPDPTQNDVKLAVVDLKPKKACRRSLSLGEIKGLKEMADSPLVRMPRLSVMPLTDKEWDKLTDLTGLS